jgi:hypothetical protein
MAGHTKQWKGQTLQFKNMEHNLFAMNPKTKEWFRIEILNGDVELLRRSLFMCCVSGIDILRFQLKTQISYITFQKSSINFQVI